MEGTTGAGDFSGVSSEAEEALKQEKKKREKAELAIEMGIAQAQKKLKDAGVNTESVNDKATRSYLKGNAAVLSDVDVQVICEITGKTPEEITTENERRKSLPRCTLVDIDTNVDPRYEIKDSEWFNQRFIRVRNYFGKARVCHFTRQQHPKTGAVHREFVAQSHDEFLASYIDCAKEAKVFLVDGQNAYECVVCKPNDQVGANELNVWRGFSVEPQEGDVSLFLDYVENVVCSGNKELNDYLLNLLAYGVQNPFDFWGVYVLLYSPEEGTGKDTLSNIYGGLFVDYFMTNKPDRIIGRFTEQIAWAPVVKLEDATITRKEMPTLRSVVNGAKLDIEGKGVKGGNIDNMMKLFWTTNERPKGISSTDRRNIAVQVSAVRRGDREYWDRLYGWKEKGGLSALLKFLQSRDIKEFNPKSERPITELLKTMQDEDLLDHDKAMLELLQEAEFPLLRTERIKVDGKDRANYVIDGRMSTTDFRHKYQERYLGIKHMSDNKLTDLFKSIGAQKKRLSGGIGNVWEFPTLDVCRANWDAGRNTRENWDLGRSIEVEGRAWKERERWFSGDSDSRTGKGRIYDERKGIVEDIDEVDNSPHTSGAQDEQGNVVPISRRAVGEF